MGFTVVFHHKGRFVRQPKLRYEEGEVHAFHNLDLDTWSYFEAIGLLKDLGYNSPVKLWWKRKGSKGQFEWVEIKEDVIAVELATHADAKKCEVHVFVEHSVNIGTNVEENRVLTYHEGGGDGVVRDGGVSGVRQKLPIRDKGVIVNEVVNEDNVDMDDAVGDDTIRDDSEASSDESVKDVYFDDSEEDRDMGLDDGFSDMEETIFIIATISLGPVANKLKLHQL
ncbi:hypothetical protein SESBI_28144 [Sesbania bispinosa]|nr:hypothetical protein SESBI_28144 [Sesbania bispinosa]